MRWRHRNEESDGNDIDLTPLIDIVFILLIFFLVSTSFIKESGIVVERPAASTGEAQEIQVVISIDKNNIIWAEGQTVDLRSITGRMEQLKQENASLAVIVAADVSSNSGVLLKVIDMCRLAGISNVSVATKES